MKGWDIIGDIHGHSAKLEGLLAKLGYHESGGVYRHPHRRVLFLGDYIDRGPEPVRSVALVRELCDAGVAFNSLTDEGTGYLLAELSKASS